MSNSSGLKQDSWTRGTCFMLGLTLGGVIVSLFIIVSDNMKPRADEATNTSHADTMAAESLKSMEHYMDNIGNMEFVCEFDEGVVHDIDAAEVCDILEAELAIDNENEGGHISPEDLRRGW